MANRRRAQDEEPVDPPRKPESNGQKQLGPGLLQGQGKRKSSACKLAGDINKSSSLAYGSHTGEG